MSAATMPASTMPSRKSAGSRNRSDPNIGPSLPRSGFCGLARRAHLVAHAPHRDDRRGIAELAAKLSHVHVDRARVARERVTPHALEQLVACQYEATMVEQLPEEVELLRRELDLLVADARFAATGIDHEIAVLDDGALALRSVGCGAAQDRAHARDELARVEGLRHVVVGAHLEPDDLVDVLVARREHQHRHVARLADALADL